MPAALPLPRRQQIVALRQAGLSLPAIAQQLQLAPSTVRDWWHRYRDQGEAGLQTHYDRCGPPAARTAPAVVQAVLALRQAHPSWGAGLIRLETKKQFPDQSLPSARQLQRWFRAAGLQPPRAKRPPVERQRGCEPHQVWQIDAKEQLRLADGTGTSVLTVTDEASGTLLGVVPFPPVPLEPGPGDPGAAGAAGVVYPLGPAGADPGG
jgi:transposase